MLPPSTRSTIVAALVALPLLSLACGDAPPHADSAAAPAAPATPADPRAPDSFRVSFETSQGDFVVQVTRAWSPRGADRFYALVNEGYFTDVRFFRVLPGFVAQFGMHGDPATNEKWSSRDIMDDPVVQTNARGTLVFATSGPNSRGNQFFINLADNARLDAMGFSPFGRVAEGMAVVDSIHGGYGEGPGAPEQGRIAMEGNAYLKRQFPNLDYIEKATIVP